MGFGNGIYIHVILPVKIDGCVTYHVPGPLEPYILPGVPVSAILAGKLYTGVVESVLGGPDIDAAKIKDISGIVMMPAVSVKEIELWKYVAEYYMCTVGEVFKAACTWGIRSDAACVGPTGNIGNILSVDTDIAGDISGRKINGPENLPVLTAAQRRAADSVRETFRMHKPAVLEGITGSGKTEIYITLAADTIASGRSVLYMVPEIAISRQLETRLENVFGERLLVYHSKITASKKKKIYSLLRKDYRAVPYDKRMGMESDGPYVVLGLRSAVFLPFMDLGLIIVDEEHDPSYKQEDPAPRYNGRDVAVAAAKIYGADIILGSATPSFETLYNVRAEKYGRIILDERYHGTEDPEVFVVDTIRAAKRKEMIGDFSKLLINNIKEAAGRGEQTVIFRNRRAYSPMVQCRNCGYIPVCPECNVKLTYHKFNNTLSCHYCGTVFRYNTICPECSSPSLLDKGAGTEKLEEELRMILPDLRIARYDADITKSIKEDKRILKAFENHEIDVLIGTQMIGKGFDFNNVTLAAIMNAETVVSQEDFRADEKAMQVLYQLMGRAGRRGRRGKFIVQISGPAGDAVKSIESGSLRKGVRALMTDRYTYGYPPFTKAIKIIIKDKNVERLEEFSKKIVSCIEECGITEFNGPFAPAVDMIAGLRIMNIWIWLKRNNSITAVKRLLYMKISSLSKKNNYGSKLVIDVDPL